MILVSNRLPVTVDWTEGDLNVYPSAGGLVTALVPLIREQGGCWAGSTGTDYDARLTGLLNNWQATHNYSLHPVFMSPVEKECFYNGFSNQVIWPLFHGLGSRCHYDSAYWHSYRNGNGKFAQVVQTMWRNGDFVWVQDYHLMLVGESLRRRGFQNRISYFHHIPFPTPDVFEALPWRTELLCGLMHYDVIGFQTLRDVRNFVASLWRFLPDTRITHVGKNLLAEANGLTASVGWYPVSIDFDEFDATDNPTTRATAAAITQEAAGRKVIVGVDRLDYTKGILQRLIGFRKLLETHRESRGRITMFQIVIPSREDIPDYKQLKINIEMLISEINGEYSTPGWTPIHYFHRAVPRDELLGYYRAADIALVTPLRDGMNLVAKEFCAARSDERGVLVLSEFAGAAEELGNGALLVNPNDADAIAASLHSALTMSDAEQERRMKKMRFTVRTNDVFQWARSFAGDTVAFAAEPLLTASRMAGD
jgi:alpha,alpha-trehalose-phosphate synthase [UDP-forming]